MESKFNNLDDLWSSKFILSLRSKGIIDSCPLYLALELIVLESRDSKLINFSLILYFV